MRPIEAHGRRVRDEEFIKGDMRVDLDELVAHAGPGEVVRPGRVRGEELGRAGLEPVR